MAKESGEIKNPQIGELSKQIVDLMDERKAQPTHDRLYKAGQEKLRQVALREYENQ